MPDESKKSFKELLPGRVKEIARGARNSPERRDIPWFRRGEVMTQLAKALDHKADTVHLDGKSFKIKYRADRAIISPMDGSFVPSANLHVPTYMEDYETYERATRVTRLES